MLYGKDQFDKLKKQYNASTSVSDNLLTCKCSGHGGISEVIAVKIAIVDAGLFIDQSYENRAFIPQQNIVGISKGDGQRIMIITTDRQAAVITLQMGDEKDVTKAYALLEKAQQSVAVQSRFVSVTESMSGQVLAGATSKSGKSKAKKAGKKPYLFYEEKAIIMPIYQDLITPKAIETQINYYTSLVNSRVGYGYGWEASGFWRTSIEHKNKYEDQAEYAPLTSLPASFDRFSPKQRSWYLYWRKEALNNNLIKTDNAYLQFFIDELLSYTFNPSAAVNVSMLYRLRENCQDLEIYISSIIYDMLLEIGEQTLAKEFAQYRSQRYNLKQAEYKVYPKIKEAEKLKSASMTIWSPYLHNSTGKFFEENKKNIHKSYKNLLDKFQTYHFENELNLGARWFEETTVIQTVKLFFHGHSALPDREIRVKQKTKIPTEVFKDDIRFLSMLAEIVLCDTQSKNPLPAGFLAYLKSQPEAPKSKKVKSSGSKTERTDQALLVEEIEPLILDLNKIQQLSAEVLVLPTLAPPKATLLAEPVNQPELAGQVELTTMEEAFLALFKDQAVASLELQAFCLQRMVMPAQLIKQINRKFEEITEKPLVVLNNDQYILTYAI